MESQTVLMRINHVGRLVGDSSLCLSLFGEHRSRTLFHLEIDTRARIAVMKNSMSIQGLEGRDTLLSVNNLGDWRARDENDLHYWSSSKDLQGCAPHGQQMV